MGRWRDCTGCGGRGHIDTTHVATDTGQRWKTRARCPRCQGLGQIPPPPARTAREDELADEHPGHAPTGDCPECVAADPFLLSDEGEV